MKAPRTKTTLHFASWLLWPALCAAACAQEYNFQYLGVDQGLSNLAVKNLYQDRQGFIWVSTESGIFRYDGQRFRAYGQEEGLPPSSGVAFAEAPDGDLLVGGEIGLYRLSGSRFSKVPLPGDRHVTWAGGLRADSKGLVYAGTNDGLLQLTETFPDRKLTILPVPLPASVTGNSIRGIITEGETVWFGCGDQMCRLSGGLIRVYGTQAGLPASRWTAIGRDMDGGLWVRGRGLGVARLAADAPTFKLQQTPFSATDVGGIQAAESDGFILFPSSHGLFVRRAKDWRMIGRDAGLKGVVYAALQDREGSIWLGMAGRGLVRWAGYKVWESYPAQSGLGSDLVYQIVPRPDGTVWVGTESGLVRGRRVASQYVWQKEPWVGTVPVHCIQADSDGTLWLGTELRGVAHVNPATGSVQWMSRAQGLDTMVPFAVLIDRQHRIWSGGDNGLYVASRSSGHFHRIEQLPSTHFWAVVQAANGDIWAGGAAGLFHLSGSTWEKYTTSEGLSRNEILALGPAGNGDLWIGYRFGGEIDKISAANGKFEVNHVLPGQSAGSHLAYFLGFDSRNRLWVGTDNGVNVMDKGRWTHIDTRDGLVWDDCDVNGFAAEPDGTVWIGTSGGLAHYTPLTHAPQAYPLSVVFTRLTLGKREVQPGDRPSVKFDSNELTAQFSDLNFTSGNALVFRYRLAPLFSEWRVTNLRELEFPGLPPGTYRLEVQARDPWGNWSSGTAAFSFAILTPWFRSWWFLSLCTLAAMLLAAFIVRLRLMVMRRRERELISLVEQRTADLKTANQELLRLSAIDGLTGVANRRAFDEFLSREWARLSRTGEPLSVLLLDVDHFKLLNDSEGHQQGDHCLVQIGAQLQRMARRETDLVARYGGEEFAVVLPTAGAADALKFAENVRRAILDLHLNNPRSLVVPFVTVSIGVGTAQHGADSTVAEFLDAVDRALYAAKRCGRNRVVFFDRAEGHRVA